MMKKKLFRFFLFKYHFLILEISLISVGGSGGNGGDGGKKYDNILLT